MHLSLVQTLVLLGLILAAGIVIKRLQGERRIKIPRMPGGVARCNAVGLAIGESICPACRDTKGFFYGPTQPDGRVLVYCGNEQCRRGYLVENFGPGMAYAETTEPGPDYLYGRRRA
jgi:hypothetical protein